MISGFLVGEFCDLICLLACFSLSFLRFLSFVTCYEEFSGLCFWRGVVEQGWSRGMIELVGVGLGVRGRMENIRDGWNV